MSGLSTKWVIVTVFIVAWLCGVGFYVWHDLLPLPVESLHPSKAYDPYAGWKRATSPKAGFTVRYPAKGWRSTTVIDSSDVEHMTLDGPSLQITIDSYTSSAPRRCSDCLAVIDAVTFKVPSLGKTDLKTSTYSLGRGQGYALTLTQLDSWLLLASPSHPLVYTSFRGTSALGSLAARRAETKEQFFHNPTFDTAEKVLRSISYST